MSYSFAANMALALAGLLYAVLWYVFIWWLRYRVLGGLMRDLTALVARLETVLTALERIDQQTIIASQPTLASEVAATRESLC